MSDPSTILSAFNDHFIEFMNDIVRVFPNDVEISTAKNSVQMIRRANPKMIIKAWKSYIVDQYSEEINSGDISFFIDNDYSNGIAGKLDNNQIMKTIERLRAPVKNMEPEDQQKTMKYIQNLTKLTSLYFTM
jgi:hypothetical protein|tara:strand:- start:1032 stop:1427 length:396 start_codon:yes stop_codon:yes gene_type:complete